ncbi:peptide chain release factor N(5)-glutamine methyltransferase [Erythrobacter sp. BLCC-B19]|uniref:peptide chain release factor N(5)-glutamine methyltransferase n=1 Tax=Erythrobacter sp. BLCC-B19 TaxID=3025315 RepID=UPI00235F2423|nr:peptide chain release factor N(5)-glutamine methyltransferase [Erythrobacter sp. BLCC-B19]WDA42407.1 peptide chain release factor N(5)-glutamine methyltransferase [Erythrobacter sp. BLCC-B19]
MTVGEAIRAAAEALASASDTARLDAELLMAHLFGVTRSELLLRHMRDPAPPGFAALVERRAAHEPVAYITGRQEFYGLPFIVTPATLIPRGDSETLVEAALAERPDAARVLDLGTGSGALLLAVLAYCRAAQGLGIDRSPEALEVAMRNAEQLGLRPQTAFRAADWHAAGWARDLGTFDLILCNPPYVETGAALDRQVAAFEPATALFAGPEGLDDYRVLIPQLRALMNAGAAAIVEIGANQADSVGALAEAAGFATRLRRDLAGRARALVLT